MTITERLKEISVFTFSVINFAQIQRKVNAYKIKKKQWKAQKTERKMNFYKHFVVFISAKGQKINCVNIKQQKREVILVCVFALDLFKLYRGYPKRTMSPCCWARFYQHKI